MGDVMTQRLLILTLLPGVTFIYTHMTRILTVQQVRGGSRNSSGAGGGGFWAGILQGGGGGGGYGPGPQEFSYTDKQKKNQKKSTPLM